MIAQNIYEDDKNSYDIRIINPALNQCCRQTGSKQTCSSSLSPSSFAPCSVDVILLAACYKMVRHEFSHLIYEICRFNVDEC
jgi:hypothetical protein